LKTAFDVNGPGQFGIVGRERHSRAPPLFGSGTLDHAHTDDDTHSYRVSNPEQAISGVDFRRWKSAALDAGAAITGAGIRRLKSQALDDAALRSSLSSTRSTERIAIYRMNMAKKTQLSVELKRLSCG